MIIIICPRCSTNNPIGSNVCGRCGTPLGDYTLSPNYMPNHRTRKKNNNSGLIAVIISLFLVFMILIGVLLFILLKPSGDDNNNQPVPTNQNISNVATILASNTGRIVSSINLNNIDDPDDDTANITINIPQPISNPVPIPYGNPNGAKQRFMNKAAEIENYEYNNLYNVSNQTDRNLNARVTFEKWDVLLNEVYAYLKNNMSKSDFKALDNDELSWIKRKESAISSAGNQHKGTAKETEARYMTGISYTRDRCYYLISLIQDQQTAPPSPPPTQSPKQKYLNNASAIESYESNIYNSTNQTDINLHARIAFEKWDVLLNEVYTHLKGQMSQSEFKALDNDELSWIKQKESAISSAVAPHSGTDKEPEARYTTGIAYTKDRCYYLISLVR